MNCLYSFSIIIDELLLRKVLIFLQLEGSSQDITRLICSSRSIDILWNFSYFKKLELSNVSFSAHVDLLPRKATNPLVFYKILSLTNTTLMKRTLIETWVVSLTQRISHPQVLKLNPLFTTFRLANTATVSVTMSNTVTNTLCFIRTSSTLSGCFLKVILLRHSAMNNSVNMNKSAKFLPRHLPGPAIKGPKVME